MTSKGEGCAVDWPLDTYYFDLRRLLYLEIPITSLSFLPPSFPSFLSFSFSFFQLFPRVEVVYRFMRKETLGHSLKFLE